MVMDVSERRVCRVADQHRSTQRRPVPPNPCRDWLVARMREIALTNPRRGHRYVMDLLHKDGWSIVTRLIASTAIGENQPRSNCHLRTD